MPKVKPDIALASAVTGFTAREIQRERNTLRTRSRNRIFKTALAIAHLDARRRSHQPKPNP